MEVVVFVRTLQFGSDLFAALLLQGMKQLCDASVLKGNYLLALPYFSRQPIIPPCTLKAL